MSYLEREQLLWEYLTDCEKGLGAFVTQDEIKNGESYLDMENGDIIIGDLDGVKCRINIEGVE
jgi:hypothetical protein